MNARPSTTEMTRAMLASDASYDGIFFTAVRTTGIFCRPSCTARKPLPRNVEYFATAREALLAGYRTCKRCRPMDTDGRPPEWIQRLLDQVDREPGGRLTDADLRVRKLDPSRVRRYFNTHYGMTFQAYHRSRRLGMALSQVRRGSGVIDVSMNTGFDSASGFRDAFVRTFGKTPGRSVGVDCMVAAWLTSPVGPLLVTANGKGICLLEFTDRRALEAQIETLRRRFEDPIVPGRNRYIDQLERELAEYFDGRLERFDVPIVISGTPFQEAVWKQLLRIPYGKTLSYEALAERTGHPGAQRAVGRANGDNRIGIVIPCHRVINKGGKLGGYGGGLWRKQFLLDLERGRREPKLELAMAGVGA